MKFNYLEKESKIYDMLQFPRILFLLNNDWKYEQGGYVNLLEGLNDKDQEDMLTSINEKLQPFKGEISKFYANEFFSSYDLFALLVKQYPFFGHESIDSYFRMILTRSNNELRENLVYSILLSNDGYTEHKEKYKETSKEIVKNNDQMIGFVKEIPTQADYKWSIMTLLENPVKMIEEYETLIKQLLPIFDEYFQKNIKEIETCQARLLKVFEEESKEQFKALTQYFVEDDMLIEENNVLISFLFAYSFISTQTSYGSFIVWGTKMEEGFKTMIKTEEDRVDKTTKIFRILGDQTRYHVLKLIASGITSTKEIAERLDVTSATISYHINSFVTNGIIKLTSSKKQKYDINFQVLNSVWDGFIADLRQK